MEKIVGCFKNLENIISRKNIQKNKLFQAVGKCAVMDCNPKFR